jgi:hypothetical protein
VGLLIFLFILFAAPRIVAFLAPKKSASDNSQIYATVNRPEKRCPPHSWFSQEVRDTLGNKLGDRTVCKYCGPLRSPGESNEQD